MKKKALIILCSLAMLVVNAQELTANWQSHFSFRNVIDVVEGNGKVYAASENVIFTYDLSTTEIATLTTVEGLSGDNISTIHFSEAFNLLIIGYETGLMEIFFEDNDNVLTIVDIVDKPTISPDRKRIYHFNEYNNLVYISADYGISVYDLAALEFGDSYFIGPGGAQIPVVQTEVFGDHIYTASNGTIGNGIRRALIDNPNLIDFQAWVPIFPGNYAGIEAIGERLYTARTNGTMLEIINSGTALSQVFNYSSGPLDVKSSNGFLTVTLVDQVYVYEEDFTLVANFTPNVDFDTEFTSAVSTIDQIFIGTQGFGLLNATHTAPTEYVDIIPDGPLRNSGFNIQAGFGSLWVAYGDYTLSYNPAPARRYGLSYKVMDDEHKLYANFMLNF